MKKENGNDMPFKADEVNWDELSGIGIMKDELELSGEMDTLLRGRENESDVPEPRAPRRGRGDGRHAPTGP